MKITKLITTLALLFNGTIAFAHGEDTAGPNGGEIRMPGAFHTEVLSMGKNQLKVYLLDLNFENPTTTDSSVEVTYTGRKSSKGNCVKQENAFICSFDKSTDLNNKGSVEINAVYKKQKGTAATYKTPLKQLTKHLE